MPLIYVVSRASGRLLGSLFGVTHDELARYPDRVIGSHLERIVEMELGPADLVPTN